MHAANFLWTFCNWKLWNNWRYILVWKYICKNLNESMPLGDQPFPKYWSPVKKSTKLYMLWPFKTHTWGLSFVLRYLWYRKCSFRWINPCIWIKAFRNGSSDPSAMKKHGQITWAGIRLHVRSSHSRSYLHYGRCENGGSPQLQWCSTAPYGAYDTI